MDTFASNGCEIAVEPGRVLVSMNRQDDRPLAAADFADRPLSSDATSSTHSSSLFYAATNDQGELVRCASSTIADRAAVAALVAGWVAEGLRVSNLGARDLGKLVRAIEKREKEAASSAKAEEAALSSDGPASSLPASETGGEGGVPSPADSPEPEPA